MDFSGEWCLNVQRPKYNYFMANMKRFSLSLILIYISTVFADTSECIHDVPDKYRKFFVECNDISRRLYSKPFLDIFDFPQGGRNFALIAGVSSYSSSSLNEISGAVSEDIKQLTNYLKNSKFSNEYETFSEIVVLENQDVNLENLGYFLQTYFPQRLREFPNSKFLFAYSGHGVSEESDSYLLLSNAESGSDRNNRISLKVVRALFDEVIKSGHHVLALINACYSGSFTRRPFGGQPLILKHKGAHAITSGGTREKSWQDPSVGKGSVFFEKLMMGLKGAADLYPKKGPDGVITVDELFTYLKQEVQISTDQKQNPLLGDLLETGSQGGFFFMVRTVIPPPPPPPPPPPDPDSIRQAIEAAFKKMQVEYVRHGYSPMMYGVFNTVLEDNNSSRIFLTEFKERFDKDSTEKVINELLTFLDDENSLTSWKAMRILIYYKYSNSKKIKDFWAKTKGWEERRIIFEAVENLPKKDALNLIMDIARYDEILSIRTEAIGKLDRYANHDHGEIIGMLLEFLDDTKINFVALQKLRKLRAENAISRLPDILLKDANFNVRKEASEFLAEQGTLESAQQIFSAYQRKLIDDDTVKSCIKLYKSRFTTATDSLLNEAARIEDNDIQQKITVFINSK